MSTEAQSPPKGIILDDIYSSALLDAYEADGYAIEKKSAPKGIRTISTLLAYRMDETRYAPWLTTKKTTDEALLLLAIFERVHLYFPEIHSGVNLDQLSGVGIESHLELHPNERQAWLKNKLLPASAKAMILGEEFRLRDNPRSRLLDQLYPVNRLFTKQDLEDLDLLHDLVITRATLDPQLAEWGHHLLSAIQTLATDPAAIPYLARTISRDIGMTRKELTLYLRRLLLNVRDDLADIRSLLRYSSEMGLPTTWQSSVGNLGYGFALPKPKTEISDDYWVVVRVLLNEVRYLSAPKTVKEALSLRESREMRRLRSLLRTWAESVHKGDIAVEKKIRNDLGKASKELRRVGTYRSIAGMLAFLSLPVSVCEMFLRLPPSASLFLNTLGGAFEVNSRITKWRNRWFIWGTKLTR